MHSNAAACDPTLLKFYFPRKKIKFDTFELRYS
mgnify:CR=1 FL=1